MAAHGEVVTVRVELDTGEFEEVLQRFVGDLGRVTVPEVRELEAESDAGLGETTWESHYTVTSKVDGDYMAVCPNIPLTIPPPISDDVYVRTEALVYIEALDSEGGSSGTAWTLDEARRIANSIHKVANKAEEWAKKGRQ